MTFRAAHNMTDRPLIIDDEGRILGGGEWGPVDDSSQWVAHHVELGELVIPENIPSNGNPDAVAAQEAADKANGPRRSTPARKADDKPTDSAEEA